MRYETKNLWGAGLASVPEKYVKEAIEKNESLTIICKGAEMTVSVEDMQKKNPRTMKHDDKWGRGEYRLYDFFWEVDGKQD